MDDLPLDYTAILSPEQRAVVDSSPNRRLFIEGTAGTGKTTAGVERFLNLAKSGIPAESILILIPQRTLALPYYQAAARVDLPPGGPADIATLGGLGQRLIDLFWPVIARAAGFAHPEEPPAFLTLETAQYYLARIVDPLLREGYFESISIDRNRLLSQILDNLNKAAAVGFDCRTIAERLKSAYSGKGAQPWVFDEAQEVALRFRQFCLDHNLLDFSLQMDIFAKLVWPSDMGRTYLLDRYRHMIFDNIEEDVPVVHRVIEEWLPDLTSALVIYDHGGGYRTFLGADPQSGLRLKEVCDDCITFHQSYVTSPEINSFQFVLQDSLLHHSSEADVDLHDRIHFSYQRYFPETVDHVARQIQDLVQNQGVSPREIVVLAPFMTDSLRFSIMSRLEVYQVPSRSHRPSRSLAEEPATHCLLTLAKLAHPVWNLRPSRQDLRYALMQAISNLDLVRADLISRIIYSENKFPEGLGPFERIQPEMRDRITYRIGEHYEIIRSWIATYRQEEPVELDVFLSRLFGEVLSVEGFGFHTNFESAAVAARLVESVQKFRRGTNASATIDALNTGKEYIRMVQDGVLAAQYLLSWDNADDDSVLLAPAYTFLMSNRPVRCQFWLDIGSQAWWERISQPLTHPYVLSQRWQAGAPWTDADDFYYNQEALVRLTNGLVQRCSDQIFLCVTGVSEQGDEQRGPLLQALQLLLRRFPGQIEVSGV